MRSVKLILVLILFGVALIIAAVVPTDINGTAGSSALGSWAMGLLGFASLATGLWLLRKGYLASRQARGGGPLPNSSRVLWCSAALWRWQLLSFSCFGHPMTHQAAPQHGYPA